MNPGKNRIWYRHGEAVVTYWSVYRQQWETIPCGSVRDEELAAMPPDEREAIVREAVKASR